MTGGKLTTKRSIIIPEEAVDDFYSFLTLPRAVLEKIVDMLSGGIYDLKNMTIDLINETGIDDNLAFSTVAVICYLNAAAEEEDVTPPDILGEVALRMEASNLSDEHKAQVASSITDNRELLLRLFSEEVRRPIEEKKSQLERGISNIAVDFRSICDIRPVFDEPAENIISWVVVMLLDIVVEDENQEESHLVVSMNNDSLKELEKVVRRARKKMDKLMNLKIEVE